MVLGVRLLVEVEGVCLLVVLMEEEELLGSGVVTQNHHSLCDSVWPSLASTSVGSEDAVCTKAAVVPG